MLKERIAQIHTSIKTKRTLQIEAQLGQTNLDYKFCFLGILLYRDTKETSELIKQYVLFSQMRKSCYELRTLRCLEFGYLLSGYCSCFLLVKISFLFIFLLSPCLLVSYLVEEINRSQWKKLSFQGRKYSNYDKTYRRLKIVCLFLSLYYDQYRFCHRTRTVFAQFSKPNYTMRHDTGFRGSDRWPKHFHFNCNCAWRYFHCILH